VTTLCEPASTLHCSAAYFASLTLLGRPYGSRLREVFYFVRDVFLCISPRVRQLGPSADRRETLPHDRKLAEFYNAGSKILGPSPKKSGAKICKISIDFSAITECCALKFLHALQIDQALLAHTRTGRGSQKILIVKI